MHSSSLAEVVLCPVVVSNCSSQPKLLPHYPISSSQTKLLPHRPSFFLTALFLPHSPISSSRPNFFLTILPREHNQMQLTLGICDMCIILLLGMVFSISHVTFSALSKCCNFQTCSPSLWLPSTMLATRPSKSTLAPCLQSARCWRALEDTLRRNMVFNFRRFLTSSMHARILLLTPTMTFFPLLQLPFRLLELQSSKSPHPQFCHPPPMRRHLHSAAHLPPPLPSSRRCSL